MVYPNRDPLHARTLWPMLPHPGSESRSWKLTHAAGGKRSRMGAMSLLLCEEHFPARKKVIISQGAPVEEILHSCVRVYGPTTGSQERSEKWWREAAEIVKGDSTSSPKPCERKNPRHM